MNKERKSRTAFRKFILTVSILAVWFVVGGVILESGVRLIIGAPLRERLPLARVKPDPSLGWRMLSHDFHYTYEIPVQLNALGFRGPDAPPKTTTEHRIVALGDSHVYGQGVHFEDLMTTVIEDRLNSANGCRAHVMNLGVRAYSLNQELTLLEQLGFKLAPTQVLLFFYINDFEEVDVTARYERFRHLDWYMFDLSAKPDPETMAKWRRIQWLRTSAFLMLAHDVYNGIRYQDNSERKILSGNLDSVVEDQLESTAAHLTNLAEAVRQLGAELTLVAIPVRTQIRFDYPSEQYQSWLAEHATHLNIEFIDPLPFMRKDYAASGKLPIIPFDGHYDVVGHRLIGTTVADRLAKRLSDCGAS